VLLHPFMPERLTEMWQQLGSPGRIDEDWSISLGRWGGLRALTQTSPGAPLFPRVEPIAPA